MVLCQLNSWAALATEKADAKGIFNALKRAVESIGLEWEELLRNWWPLVLMGHQ